MASSWRPHGAASPPLPPRPAQWSGLSAPLTLECVLLGKWHAPVLRALRACAVRALWFSLFAGRDHAGRASLPCLPMARLAQAEADAGWGWRRLACGARKHARARVEGWPPAW